MTTREKALGALLAVSVVAHLARPTHYEPPPVVRQEFPPKPAAVEEIPAPELVLLPEDAGPEPIRMVSSPKVRVEFTPHRARSQDAGQVN